MSLQNTNNLNSTETRIILLDTTPSTTSATAVDDTGASYTFDTWTSSTYVNVTLTASDTGSGVDTILYCTDTTNTCTPNLTYSTPVQISTEGVSYIRFKANDTVGNDEQVRNETIKIDTTLPLFNAIRLRPLQKESFINMFYLIL